MKSSSDRKAQMSKTKCWECARTCAGNCPWIMKGTPVNGWNAVRCEFSDRRGHTIESYEVAECPLYIDDSHLPEINVDDRKALDRLIHNIVAMAVNDHIDVTKFLKGKKSNKACGYNYISMDKARWVRNETENFFKSEYFGTLVDLDGRMLVEMLKDGIVPKIRNI